MTNNLYQINSPIQILDYQDYEIERQKLQIKIQNIFALNIIGIKLNVCSKDIFDHNKTCFDQKLKN